MFRMTEDRFQWRLPSYAILGALILFAPVAFCEPDISWVIYVLVGLIISVAFVAFAVKDAVAKRPWRCLSLLSMVAIYWAISAGLAGNYLAIRTVARWLVWSHVYKSAVLAQPASANGELKHSEWDGWGWAGQDTTVYVVFDPTNSLFQATKTHQSGKFNGLPCDVYRVRRLENHWYAAQFYTDEFWDRCQ